MTTIITFNEVDTRAGFYTSAKPGRGGHYVSVADYEAQAAELNQLRKLLARWKAKSDDGIIDDTFNGVRSPELEQLIADTTEAAKPEQAALW